MSKRVGIIGSGKFGKVIIEGIEGGKTPDWEIAGIVTRHSQLTLADLVDMKPDVIVEAASQSFLKENLEFILKAGISVIPLSAGVFADQDFVERMKKTAEESGARVYLTHGASGGFDLAKSLRLMDKPEARVVYYRPEGGSPLNKIMPEDFSGTILEGFKLGPDHLNILIAAAIACGGFDNTGFEVRRAERQEMGFSLELDSQDIGASIILHRPDKSKEPGVVKLVAYSVLSTLNDISSWIHI